MQRRKEERKKDTKRDVFQSASDFQDGPLLGCFLTFTSYYFGYFVFDGGRVVYMNGEKSNSRFSFLKCQIICSDISRMEEDDSGSCR
jgi:hypothetical protein